MILMSDIMVMILVMNRIMTMFLSSQEFYPKVFAVSVMEGVTDHSCVGPFITKYHVKKPRTYMSSDAIRK